jgi:NADPH-dependent ferric siderophore reductase
VVAGVTEQDTEVYEAGPHRRARARDHVPMSLYELTVSRVSRLAPHYARVTFTGPELAGFADDGPDQRGKLLLPRPGQDAPVMPDLANEPEGWYAAWRAQPDGVRSIMRTYTVRGARPESSEIDIDFVLHGDTGPGSSWAGRAAVGQRVAFVGSYAEYDPAPDTEWELLIGDETALPAIGAIFDRLGDRPAIGLAEVSGAPDYLGTEAVPIARHPFDVVERIDDEGSALAAAVEALTLPDGPGYVWLCGESATVRRLRRHLVNDRGIEKNRIMFQGYWRYGVAIDPD